LEQLFLKMNYDDAYRQYPAAIYHEYYKTTLGCRGAGNGAFYIDPLGEVHACPFCRKSAGNLLTDQVDECVDRMRKKGCAVPLTPPTQKEEAELIALETL
jgi:MoaA/NifB/PqqE/SkfB family radical SAM enzyme